MHGACVAFKTFYCTVRLQHVLPLSISSLPFLFMWNVTFLCIKEKLKYACGNIRLGSLARQCACTTILQLPTINLLNPTHTHVYICICMSMSLGMSFLPSLTSRVTTKAIFLFRYHLGSPGCRSRLGCSSISHQTDGFVEELQPCHEFTYP